MRILSARFIFLMMVSLKLLPCGDPYQLLKQLNR